MDASTFPRACDITATRRWGWQGYSLAGVTLLNAAVIKATGEAPMVSSTLILGALWIWLVARRAGLDEKAPSFDSGALSHPGTCLPLSVW